MSISDIELLKTFSQDRFLGMTVLFQGRHKQESPPFHASVVDLWRSADRFVLIEAFRGGAKSSLSEEFMLLEAAFGNFKYALIFGETYTKACQRLEAIKHEINNNHHLSALFGHLYRKGCTWSENKIVLANNVCIEAHGWEEEIRGFKHLDMRPDRAYLDDIENKENTRDTSAVHANWQKIHLQLIPALDVDGKIRMTGTPLADDCLISRAKASKWWVSASFPICNGDIDNSATQSAWPARFPMEAIRQMRDMAAENGMLREFNQEYMLIATGSQGKPFTEDMIREQDLAPTVYAPRVAIYDPARTVEVKKSDQTGHVVVSAVGTRIYVHESGGDYWQPDEIIDSVFTADADEVVIEKNSLDEWLMQPIRKRQLDTGKLVNIRAVTAPQEMDKAAFIMGLRPYFVAGDIILVGGRAKHAQLVSQILNFPSGKRDILNALAYTLKVFSGVPVYGNEFGAENVVSGYEVPRGTPLLLALNATNTETTAALVAVRGRAMTVVQDWASPMLPLDTVPDIVRLVRAAFPGHKLTAWAPQDVFDQVGRNALLAACEAARLPVQPASHAAVSRGSLVSYMRTAVNGRRLLLVEGSGCPNVMHALARGYHWPVKPGGERGADPQRNVSRTLMEALETLTFALDKPDNGSLADHANATNVLGTPYISALPRR